MWNLAYDAGMGVGAAGFGLLIGPVGYAAGFALTACVLLAALALARRDASAGRVRRGWGNALDADILTTATTTGSLWATRSLSTRGDRDVDR